MNETTPQDNLEFELSQYLDGQLSRGRARRLERRIEQDPALREQLRKYAALEGRLSALGKGTLAGADYDGQREEVVRLLERRRLLEARPRRPVFLRPVFLSFSGGLAAVAAALMVGLWLWVFTKHPTAAPVQTEVSVVMHRARAPRNGQAELTVRRLDPRDIHLPSAGLPEPASLEDMPPGTVMVSVSPAPREQAAMGLFPFSVDMQ